MGSCSYNHTTDYAGKTSLSGAMAYACNPREQRTSRVTKNGALTLTEYKKYDNFGRLTEIKSGNKVVQYIYNGKNQLSAQIVDNVPIEFSYTKYGQLESKTLGGRVAPVSSLKYIYSKDGMIAGRVIDGKFQMYSYDKKRQLLSVADMQGNVAEQYVYDPAGNILSKTIDGKTTTYTDDKANQLVTSVVDGKVTRYAYDAAGRMVKEGDKAYTYGYLDKILSVQENGKQTAAFDYHVDGQIASATHGDKSESFLWDGLALIHRGDNAYINEPYVTGGNPILSSKDGVMFNDMLGNTLGTKSVDKFSPVAMTAFGETADKSAMFTGKPYIGELGYTFLFRNYRPSVGKWQTADPIGYPDGWNNLAYGNNNVFSGVDVQGGEWVVSSGEWPQNQPYTLIDNAHGFFDFTFAVPGIVWILNKGDAGTYDISTYQKNSFSLKEITSNTYSYTGDPVNGSTWTQVLTFSKETETYQQIVMSFDIGSPTYPGEQKTYQTIPEHITTEITITIVRTWTE